MCSHFEAVVRAEQLQKYFDVGDPFEPLSAKVDVWPRYDTYFIRAHEFSDVGDEAVPDRELMIGQFGLVPHWAKETKSKYSTFNARAETVAQLPTFRDAWRNAQKCIVPVQAFYEPDWRSGKAIATRFELASGEPMGIAGLWSRWTDGDRVLHSFTMLTVNADEHPLMKNYHRPTEEKRMVVILRPEQYSDWLTVDPQRSQSYMNTYPAKELVFSGMS